MLDEVGYHCIRREPMHDFGFWSVDSFSRDNIQCDKNNKICELIEVRPFLAVSVHLKNETFLVSF